MARDEDPGIPALARYLRQRMELGANTWILEETSAKEASRLVQDARRRPAPGSPAPGAPTSGSTAGGTGAPSRAELGIVRPTQPDGGTRSEGGGTRSKGEPVGAPVSAPASPPSDRAPLPTDYEALREEALTCTRCRLCEGRDQVVFADGNPSARVMVVGEAPGANEDRTGLPFVGAAGKLLDLLLASVDLSRDASVYICNVIKCRPPKNRDPKTDEIEACAPYLHRQIELVKPEAILAVGTFAGRLLSGHDRTLGRLRGEVHSYRGTPLVVTYHPAALLRNSGWTRPTWEDLQLLRDILDGS